MKITTSASLLVLTVVAGCGDQLVEFPRPGSLLDGRAVADARDPGDLDATAGFDGPDGAGGQDGPDGPRLDGGSIDGGSIDGSLALDAGPCTLLPVDLRSAGDFAILAGSTVTNTGPTTIIGDLGLSPGTDVTGFLPGIVVGAQHAGDPTAAQAIAHLDTAYRDAAGRTLCPIAVAGNLGGTTLTPGLYKSTSSLEISSGELTLDGQGDPDAVFIFQMASTLTTTVGRQIVLIRSAQASNVFWQVGSSATLGSTSVFQGTILADQSITLNTGATLNGRALAHIGAVSLDANTVVRPAP